MVNNELRSVAKRGGLNDICEWREGVIRDGYDVQSREILCGEWAELNGMVWLGI